MPFYPEDAPVPAGLRTDEFVLRMLAATDVELDYDAVIASKDMLHLRSGGSWPREGFTLAENLADLQGHEADFHARRGFTYTIMDPGEMQCLGCLYIYPLRVDPVATVLDGCVGCGLCGENAHAAALCPSFYRAEVIENPNWRDRVMARVRSAMQSMIQRA